MKKLFKLPDRKPKKKDKDVDPCRYEMCDGYGNIYVCFKDREGEFWEPFCPCLIGEEKYKYKIGFEFSLSETQRRLQGVGIKSNDLSLKT